MFELEMLVIVTLLGTHTSLEMTPKPGTHVDEESCNVAARSFVDKVSNVAKVGVLKFNLPGFTMEILGGCVPKPDVPMM